jgi:DNA-binding transcriptional MerR regulator
MRISQLAERSGVPATTLRFYETAGLLPAGRTASGYRAYDEGAVERLAFIGTAKRLGLPLEEIAELLAVRESGACAEVRDDLRPRLASRISQAEARAAELAAFTDTLHRALDHLDALPDRAERCGPACGFPAEPAEAAEPAAIACSLSAGALGERTDAWRRLTAGADVRRVTGGLRLTVPAARAGELAALAAAEQQCCPFFDFRLHLAGPVLHLEVRAPAEAAPFLSDLFPTP